MAAGNGDEILYNEVYLPPYFLSPISRTKVTFPLALVTNFQLCQYFILFSPSNNSSSPITASFQSISLPSLLQRSTPVSKLEVTFCTQFNGGKGREGGIGDGITTQQLSLCLSPQILTRSKVSPLLPSVERKGILHASMIAPMLRTYVASRACTITFLLNKFT